MCEDSGNLIPGGCFTLDFQGLVSEVNLMGPRFLDLEGSEIIGTPFRRLVASEFHPVFDDFLKKIFNKRTIAACDVRLQGQGQTPQYVHLEGHMISASPNMPECCRALVVDTTHYRDSATELEFRNLILSTQQEASLEGILAVDDNGRILSFNQRFLDMWHIPAAEIKPILDGLLLRTVCRQILHPQAFLESVCHLYQHHDETSDDEIRLVDGRTLFRHSAPIKGATGAYYGRVWFFRDVTEGKKAEETIRENEEKFRAIYEGSNDAIMLLTETGFIDCNERTVEMFGMTGKEDFCAAHPANVSPPFQPDGWDSRSAALAQIRAAFKKGHQRFEWVHRKAGGEDFIADVLLSSFVCAGKTTLQATVRDITDQKKMLESLQKSEQELRLTLEATTDGIWQWNLVDNTIWFSPKYYAMLGYEPGEFEASFQAWREMIHPDDQDRAVEVILDFVRGATVEYKNEFRLRTKDGDYCWIRASARVGERDDQGNAVRVIGNHQDITDLKHADEMIRESKKLYERLTEQSLAGIYLIKGGCFIFLNSRAASMSGCNPGELIGIQADSIIHPEDRKDVRENARRMLRGEINAPYEFRIMAKDGKIRWVMETVSAIRNGGDQVILGNCMDITEKKSEEEKRQFLECQLQQAQRMEALGTLAGGIAHDFNNILSSVMGFTELAIRESHADKRLNHLEQVMKASERAKNLTGQILDFSRRAEEGKKSFDIRPIVKETLKLMKASLPSTILIKQNIISKPATVLADPTQIHQVMMNLCTNAAYAMREKGGVLHVHLSLIDIDQEMALLNPDINTGPHIQLKISDTGHGIDPDIIDRIFHPFFTTKKQGEGTGLGLSVVYGIVKNHGGAISVQSSLKSGTTFTVYLPSLSIDVATNEMKSPVSTPGGRERILFVDDESAIVTATEQYLGSLGYDVVATSESLEALEIFRKAPNRIDLVITDMTMPQLTGLELSKEILTIQPGIPIILCTGYSQLIQEKLLKQQGIRELVKKPITMADLSRRIRQVLDER